MSDRLAPFFGMSDRQMLSELGLRANKKSKQYKRLIANIMLGVSSNSIEEFDKSNVTMKVVTLEHDGKLKESISFPYFDYKKIIKQKWEESDFHQVLEENRFLFIIFRKSKTDKAIYFEGFKFWNFPAADLPEAEKVWKKARLAVKKGEYSALPKIADSSIAHVRPHGRNREDKIETPQGKMEMKRCFWLNAKYIKKSLEN